jgi:hypothetical protein
MAVTEFRSTDAAAPVLTGQTGSLLALLDACLIVGYGAKSPLGWNKPFSGTNKAVYRPPAGPQHMLRVDDAYGGTESTKIAACVGYETMSTVDAGAGPYPTAAQQTNGVAIVKSITTDATARPWVLVGNNKAFYLMTLTALGNSGSGDTVAGTDRSGFFFGAFKSIVPGDIYNSAIEGGRIAGSALMFTCLGTITHSFTTFSNSTLYLCRPATGVIGAVLTGKNVDYMGCNASTWAGRDGLAYPAPDGNLWLQQFRIMEPTTKGFRGTMPGLWSCLHPWGTLADLDTVSNVVGAAGKTLTTYRVRAADSAYGQERYAEVLIETSDSWDN